MICYRGRPTQRLVVVAFLLCLSDITLHYQLVHSSIVIAAVLLPAMLLWYSMIFTGFWRVVLLVSGVAVIVVLQDDVRQILSAAQLMFSEAWL